MYFPLNTTFPGNYQVIPTALSKTSFSWNVPTLFVSHVTVCHVFVRLVTVCPVFVSLVTVCPVFVRVL